VVQQVELHKNLCSPYCHNLMSVAHPWFILNSTYLIPVLCQ